MYIYAFGSICRGEIDFYSDVDLIAISDDFGVVVVDLTGQR